MEDLAPPADADVDPILKESSVSPFVDLGNHLPIFDQFAHGQEHLFDICCVLGRSLGKGWSIDRRIPKGKVRRSSKGI